MRGIGLVTSPNRPGDKGGVGRAGNPVPGAWIIRRLLYRCIADGRERRGPGLGIWRGYTSGETRTASRGHSDGLGRRGVRNGREWGDRAWQKGIFLPGRYDELGAG